jgi:hypothetical protein
VSGLPADTRAAAGAVNFFLFGGRWVCLTTVLALCGARGAFTSPGGWSRAGVTIGWLFVYMLLELIGSFFTAAGDPVMALPRWLANSTVLLTVLLPLPLAIYSFWWLNLRHAGAAASLFTRWLAIGGSTGIAAVGILVMVAGISAAARRDRDPAYIAAQELKSRHRDFEILTAHGSLSDFLNFTRLDEPGPVRARALAAIAARPDLLPELAAQMQITDLYASSQAVCYLGEMKPAPPGLAAPFRKFLERVNQDMRDHIERGRFGETGHGFIYASQAALIGARALQVDVTAELKAMARLLETSGNEPAQAAALPIEDYLAHTR